METLPQAIVKDVLREASKKDKEIRNLMEDISLHNECCQDFLKPYRGIFNELWTTDGIVLKGNQAVLPVTLWSSVIGLSHEGHQCADKTFRLLRQVCWFPGMRKQVQDFVASCFLCNAAQPHTHTVPMQPNFLPDRPWQKINADFKRPIGRNTTYMLLSTNILNFLRLTLYPQQALRNWRPYYIESSPLMASQRHLPLTMDHHILAMKWQNMQRKWELNFCL